MYRSSAPSSDKSNSSCELNFSPVSSSLLTLVEMLSNSVNSIGCRVTKYKLKYILLNASISSKPSIIFCWNGLYYP